MATKNRPSLDCPECGVPLIPAHSRGRLDRDGNENMHGLGCWCRWCDWWWWESNEPTACACGTAVYVRADDDHAYATTRTAMSLQPKGSQVAWPKGRRVDVATEHRASDTVTWRHGVLVKALAVGALIAVVKLDTVKRPQRLDVSRLWPTGHRTRKVEP